MLSFVWIVGAFFGTFQCRYLQSNQEDQLNLHCSCCEDNLQLFKTLGHIVLCHKCDCTQHSQTEGKLLVLIVSLLPDKLLDPFLDDRGEVAEAAFYLSILIQALHCINYEPFKIK